MFYPHNLQHWTIVSHHKNVCSTLNCWQCDNSDNITRQCNYRYTAMTSCAVFSRHYRSSTEADKYYIHQQSINITGTYMDIYWKYLCRVWIHSCVIALSPIGFSPDNCSTHLYTQKNCTVNRTETKAAASTGSISTGWSRNHITTIAT